MRSDLAARVMLFSRSMAASSSARPSPKTASPSRSIHTRIPTRQSFIHWDSAIRLTPAKPGVNWSLYPTVHNGLELR